MVSIEPYSVSEYVFVIIASYVLLGLFILVMAIGDYMNEKKLYRALVAVVVGFGGLTALMAAPIRLGDVMFINGVLFICVVFSMVNLISSYMIFKVD